MKQNDGFIFIIVGAGGANSWNSLPKELKE